MTTSGPSIPGKKFVICWLMSKVSQGGGNISFRVAIKPEEDYTNKQKL